MTKQSIVALIALVVVVAGGGFLLFANRPSASSLPSSQTANIGVNTAPQPAGATSSASGGSAAIVFADSRYASNSYLISTTSTYDAATQQALKGFQVKKQMLPDGSLQIKIIALQSEYPTQTYTVTAGEKLYFAEASAGDDAASEDHFPADDHAILVSADGHIVP